MRILKKILVSLSIVSVVLCLIFAVALYNFANSPSSDAESFSILDIKPGMTLRQVTGQLESLQLVSNRSTFLLLTYIQGKQDQIRAGEYRLSPTMPPQEILSVITEGRSILHTLTIPEGYHILEIAKSLEDAGLADGKTFIQETRNPSLLQELNLPVDTLEGYLYPETYRFSKNTTEQQMVRKMVDTFKARAYTPELLEKAKSLNMTFHEVVTLASLIEKETGLASERELISSVFHNRLRKRMRLQTDPTVIYAMAAQFDGNIRKKDLKIDSPYNTYVHKGLPPGPIASPGLESILAALSPVSSNKLYFVSRQDGSHEFSSNLEDHNRAVRKYQLRRRTKS